MTFYKKCLGGELRFQRIGESPLSERMPAKMKNCVLHAVLANVDFVLMGSDMVSEKGLLSDMVSEKGLLKGNAVSLVLNCASEKEARARYKKLSQGGKQTHPLENTFWNALFGELTDKYGNTWMLSYNGQS